MIRFTIQFAIHTSMSKSTSLLILLFLTKTLKLPSQTTCFSAFVGNFEAGGEFGVKRVTRYRKIKKEKKKGFLYKNMVHFPK